MWKDVAYAHNTERGCKHTCMNNDTSQVNISVIKDNFTHCDFYSKPNQMSYVRGIVRYPTRRFLLP